MCFGGGTPDYTGAAEKEGQASLANTNLQTFANRPNISTPMGTMSWENKPYIDPATGQSVSKWNMNVSLSPDQQAALDRQMNLNKQKSDLAGGLMGQVSDNFQNPLDFSGLPGMPDASGVREQAIGAAYDQMKSRLDPMWADRERSFRGMSLAEGGDPRSDPYQTQLLTMGRDRNDAYGSALNNSIITGGNQASQYFDMGMKSRQQALSELLQQRSQPFNEMQALLGGSQVAMPQFPGFSNAGVAQTPQYLAAANMQGQANLAQNKMMADLIGAGMGAAGNVGMGFAFG